MKVLNKSNRTQEVRITDRYQHMYKIYLPAGRSTDLEPYQVSEDVISLLKQGIFIDLSKESLETVKEISFYEEDSSIPEIIEKLAENKPIEEPSPEDESIEVVEESLEVNQMSVFKCEYCGNEYGSQRGLNMHINKVHANTIKEEV